MQAVLNDRIVAESDNIILNGGYIYFPAGDTHVEWLQKAPKTDSDRACPHGVQFYDLVLDGERHERVAWVYEAPQPKMAEVKDRFGFWKDVKVVS